MELAKREYHTIKGMLLSLLLAVLMAYVIHSINTAFDSQPEKAIQLIAMIFVIAIAIPIFTHFVRYKNSIEPPQFGYATEYKIGDYESNYEEAIRAGWSLDALLPRDYRLDYPEQSWEADYPSWIYYATRKKPPGAKINYVIQLQSDPAPDGAEEIMKRDGVSVYV